MVMGMAMVAFFTFLSSTYMSIYSLIVFLRWRKSKNTEAVVISEDNGRFALSPGGTKRIFTIEVQYLDQGEQIGTIREKRDRTEVQKYPAGSAVEIRYVHGRKTAIQEEKWEATKKRVIYYPAMAVIAFVLWVLLLKII